MNVFLSADLEGTAFAVTRESLRPGGHDYERSRQEMTLEVLAAAEGARAAGADPGGGPGRPRPGINPLPEQMPDYVELIRGWSYEPRMMVEGLDEHFDAALFVGYHSAAGQEGNALSHTISGAAAPLHPRQRSARIGVFDLQLAGGLLRRAQRPAHRRSRPV